MTTATAEFVAADAIEAAFAALRVQHDEVVERVERDAADAREKSASYAHHLAGGGDPLDYPDASRWGDTKLVSAFTGLEQVYRYWNIGRGSRNPIMPFRAKGPWRVAELLFSRFGEPVAYAEIAQVGSEYVRITSDKVAGILRTIAEETKCEIVPRRTKVGGKVAYLIRDRQDGDEDIVSDDDGSYRASSAARSRDLIEER